MLQVIMVIHSHIRVSFIVMFIEEIVDVGRCFPILSWPQWLGSSTLNGYCVVFRVDTGAAKDFDWYSTSENRVAVRDSGMSTPQCYFNLEVFWYCVQFPTSSSLPLNGTLSINIAVNNRVLQICESEFKDKGNVYYVIVDLNDQIAFMKSPSSVW